MYAPWVQVERLSPWDLEPLDPERLPAVAGGAVAVLPHELEVSACSMCAGAASLWAI